LTLTLDFDLNRGGGPSLRFSQGAESPTANFLGF
jgi:hypothetical protein